MFYIPSYVQDTTDFLCRIFDQNKNLPHDIILITIDVKSLYTNIPNDEGIKACIDMLKEYNTINPEIEQSIFNILTLILNKNSFSFNNEHFLQIHGTAMGSPMAPTYANIFIFICEPYALVTRWNYNQTSTSRQVSFNLEINYNQTSTSRQVSFNLEIPPCHPHSGLP